MAQTMKAWQYNSTKGGIEKNLEINDTPVPTINDDEILVSVYAMALNPVDHKVTEGPLPLRLIGSNLTPGGDFCGKVAKVGKKVDEYQIGEWVFGCKVGALTGGSLAQYISVQKGMVARLPEGVKVEDAASVSLVGLTEYQAIAPNVKSGDKVFINGGSGGTGVIGIQIAKALGCHVTTTSSTPNVELCKSLGADEVIDYKTTDVVKHLASKGPVFNLAVDNVGTPANLYKASSSFLVPSAKFVQIGSTPSLGAIRQVGSNMFLPGFLGGGKNRYQMMFAKASADTMRQFSTWMKEGKMRGVLDSVYEFEDAPKAYEKLKTGRARGKVVIRVTQEEA